MSIQNPLVIAILSVLKSRRAPMSEHELLTELKERGDFTMVLSKASDLVLFQRHFLIMNALYHLQSQLLEEGLCLHISPLKIVIDTLPSGATKSVGELNESSELREYYLDLNNFESTTEQDVDALLRGFWERYVSLDKTVEAFAQLGLAVEATWREVKEAYRQLAAEHHPDRGGDQDRFIEIRTAYEVLSKAMAH